MWTLIPVWTVDFETQPIGPRPEHYPPAPVSVSIRHPDGDTYFFAWGHPGGNNCSFEDARRALKAIWDEDRPIVFHNAKFDTEVAYVHFGLPELPWQRIHDTMWLAFLVDPYARSLGLKQLGEVWLHMPKDEQDAVVEWVLEHKNQLPRFDWMISKTTGKPQNPTKTNAGAWIAYVPADIVGPYANGDTDRTWKLFQLLYPVVEQAGMFAAYDRERQVMPIFQQNERQGLRVDTERLEQDIAVYHAAFEYAEQWLRWRLNSQGLNFDADDDVAEALERNGVITEWVKTKTGKRSTAKDNMRPDMFNDPQVASVLGYRNRLKTCLKMFMEPWLKQALHRDGWISTSWNQVASDLGGTRCMPAGRLVQTSRGYIPVEDVIPGDEVLSHTGNARRVTAVFDNGNQPCFCVVLTSGHTLVTTGNHEFWTGAAWVRADSLAKEQTVIIAGPVETWRPVPEWEGLFEVSSWGRVRNARTGLIRKLQKKGVRGHLKVTLKAQGRKSDYTVHRLVARAFGIPGEGPEVRHVNGIAWDNCVWNLQWGTSSENKEDAKQHGTMWPRLYKYTKLSEEAAARIRALPVASRWGDTVTPTNAQLAEEYGVNPRLIRAVRNGQRWQSIPDTPRPLHFEQSRVEVVVPVGTMRTFGVEVEVDHSHVTAGIVTHNTGRPSTNNPNLLNISKTFEGRGDGYVHPEFLGLPPLPLVRRYIRADEGCVVLKRDFSGQELRVFAHGSQGRLLQKYTEDPNLDVHHYVGAEIGRLTGDDIWTSADGRTRTKAMNFQGLYGGGIPALCKALRISYNEAKRFKAFHDQALPDRRLFSDTLGSIVRTGYAIRTWGGRLYRRPPFKKQKNGSLGDADYILINYYCQGSASDITKEAMIRLHNHPDFNSRFMLQVYDELNISAPIGEAQRQMEVMREVMEGIELRVPLLTDGEWGFTWGDMNKIKGPLEEAFAGIREKPNG